MTASFAQAEGIEIVVPENVTEAQDLEAWARIYEFVSHPRCSNCYVGQSDQPHMPPAVDGDWRLAPVEAAWFGKTAAEIWSQLRNPDTNGGLNFEQIAGHLDHDVVLRWAWSPGGGREPAPFSLQEHTNDVLAWGAAGMPFPEE